MNRREFEFVSYNVLSDVKLFFVDFHSGDYTVDLVISGDKPELATISIAIEKFWNRVILLAVFLLGFAALVLGAVLTTALNSSPSGAAQAMMTP